MQSQSGLETIIGISEIKRRRLELPLRSHPGLHMGECVPFYVSGYGDGEDAPDKPLSIMPGAEENALAVLTQHPETKVRLDRVMKLVEGFESSFGLELLASVHWLAVQEKANSTETIIQKMYAWNNRKRQFTHRQIILAVNVLQNNGWL